MTKIVVVTKADLLKGQSSNTVMCPVALALRRAGFTGVEVYNLSARTDQGKVRHSHRTKEFIGRVDRGEKVGRHVFLARTVLDKTPPGQV